MQCPKNSYHMIVKIPEVDRNKPTTYLCAICDGFMLEFDFNLDELMDEIFCSCGNPKVFLFGQRTCILGLHPLTPNGLDYSKVLGKQNIVRCDPPPFECNCKEDKKVSGQITGTITSMTLNGQTIYSADYEKFCKKENHETLTKLFCSSCMDEREAELQKKVQKLSKESDKWKKEAERNATYRIVNEKWTENHIKMSILVQNFYKLESEYLAFKEDNEELKNQIKEIFETWVCDDQHFIMHQGWKDCGNCDRCKMKKKFLG